MRIRQSGFGKLYTLLNINRGLVKCQLRIYLCVLYNFYNLTTCIEFRNRTRVVLKQFEAEETTASGIVLPGQAQEKPQQAKVIAVGPGTDDVKMQVKVGDAVIYSKYAGTDVKLDDEEFVIVRQDDILAIVK